MSGSQEQIQPAFVEEDDELDGATVRFSGLTQKYSWSVEIEPTLDGEIGRLHDAAARLLSVISTHRAATEVRGDEIDALLSRAWTSADVVTSS